MGFLKQGPVATIDKEVLYHLFLNFLMGKTSMLKFGSICKMDSKDGTQTFVCDLKDIFKIRKALSQYFLERDLDKLNAFSAEFKKLVELLDE